MQRSARPGMRPLVKPEAKSISSQGTGMKLVTVLRRQMSASPTRGMQSK